MPPVPLPPESSSDDSSDLPPHPSSGHEPVLLQETIDLLNPPPGGTVIDCTLGHAGHASTLAQRLGPGGLLIGIDVDPKNLEIARDRLAAAPCRVRLFQGNFAELPDVMNQADCSAA